MGVPTADTKYKSNQHKRMMYGVVKLEDKMKIFDAQVSCQGFFDVGKLDTYGGVI